MMHSISSIILPNTFQAATLSNIAKKSLATYKKVTIKPIQLNNSPHLQMTYHYDNAVVHQDYAWQNGVGVIKKLLSGYFKQAIIKTTDADYHILSNKKGRIRIVK